MAPGVGDDTSFSSVQNGVFGIIIMSQLAQNGNPCIRWVCKTSSVFQVGVGLFIWPATLSLIQSFETRHREQEAGGETCT